MMGVSELPRALESESPAEFARFRDFLETHVEMTLSWGNSEIPYCVCGRGARTILTLAGGWGGIEMLYETILGFEGVDLSFTDDALDAVVEQAIERKVGARGLRIILEELMLDIMYQIPSVDSVKECVISEDVIFRKEEPILLYEQTKKQA